MTIPDPLLLLNHGSLDPRLKSCEGWKGITSLDILRLHDFFPEPHELTPPFAEDEFLPVLTSFKKTKVLTFDIVNKRVSEPTKDQTPMQSTWTKNLEKVKHGHNMPKQPKQHLAFHIWIWWMQGLHSLKLTVRTWTKAIQKGQFIFITMDFQGLWLLVSGSIVFRWKNIPQKSSLWSLTCFFIAPLLGTS